MRIFRPRCENCGAKLYPTDIPSRWRLFGTIPSYCPVCGKEISNQIRARIDEYQSYGLCLLCILIIAIITVVIIISFQF